MKGKGFEIVFVLVLVNFTILGVHSQVDESNEDAHPNYEYIQLFRSIPALFEYLLDALEERPEILEKNDVTMFNRNIGVADTEEDESENSDSDMKMDNREADCDNSKEQDEHGVSNEVYKRDASTSKDVSKTTVAYEYGNSNVVMKGLDQIENNKVFAKRFANNDNFNNFAEETERELINRENRIIRKKRSVLSKLDDDINDMLWNDGEVFLGFENMFGLDLKPEEIEERILTAEKLLEEHNNKKNGDEN